MKTLKICRMASFVPMMAFFVVFFACRTLDTGFDGFMATVFGAMIIFGSISFYARVKNENNPVYLAKTERGMIIANFITPVLLTALYIIVDFSWELKGYFTWLGLAVISGVVYSTVNNIILYKAKKAYDTGNSFRNS
ncbi:MAG: hypothetical protein J6B97_06490 [Bacteroidales bacterium]|nr:hypothetical protein [Bacteroidales bacterium]